MSATKRTEWNARVYHEVSNPHVGWGATVIESLELGGDELVADVGCGTGRVTAQLLERLPTGRVIAIDRSANMIEEARQHLDSRFPGQVTYLQADLLAIEPKDIGAPVDLVFSTATFHWIKDHNKLFANMYALLRPGGRIIAQCGGGPNLKRQVDRTDRIMVEMPFKPFFEDWDLPKFYADQEGTAMRLRRAGFIEVETSLVSAPTVLEDEQAFSTFLTNVIFREHLQQIPDERLQEAFIAELATLSAADNPPFLLDYWRLNMRGKRPND